jgi:hypothetical protein
MRRFVLFYGLIVLILVGLIVIWQKQSGAEKTLVQYQKIASFSHREMTYTSVVHPLVGDGVVLYGVQMAGISAPHRIDRLLMRIKTDEIVLKATDVQILIGQALAKRHGDNLINVFRTYQPINDILTKPFETLTLLGLDQLTGDWTISLRPQGEKAIVSALWTKGKKVIAQIDATVYIPSVERGRLWGWTRGWITDMTVRLNDIGMLRSYAGYLTASGVPVPAALSEAITRLEPLAMRIELQQPLTIANWIL